MNKYTLIDDPFDQEDDSQMENQEMHEIVAPRSYQNTHEGVLNERDKHQATHQFNSPRHYSEFSTLSPNSHSQHSHSPASGSARTRLTEQHQRQRPNEVNSTISKLSSSESRALANSQPCCIDPQSMNCRDIFEHIHSCPVCSTLIKSQTRSYLMIIAVLIFALLLMYLSTQKKILQ